MAGSMMRWVLAGLFGVASNGQGIMTYVASTSNDGMAGCVELEIDNALQVLDFSRATDLPSGNVGGTKINCNGKRCPACFIITNAAGNSASHQLRIDNCGSVCTVAADNSKCYNTIGGNKFIRKFDILCSSAYSCLVKDNHGHSVTITSYTSTTMACHYDGSQHFLLPFSTR